MLWQGKNNRRMWVKGNNTIPKILTVETLFKHQRKSIVGFRRNNRGFLQNCCHYLKEYTQNSTIHGLNYLTAGGLFLFEKICWLIVIITSLSTCIALIWTLYNKWTSSPLIVSFTTIEKHIFEIPFPAVTICPEVKSNVFIFNYTDTYLKMKANRTVSGRESKYFHYTSLVCSTPPELMDKDMTTVSEEAIDYLIKASPHLEDFVYDVKWIGSHFYENSSKLLTPILTSEGLCYTFNMMNRNEIYSEIVKDPRNLYSTSSVPSQWSAEKGYTPDAGLDAYPRRTLAEGIEEGLIIKLRFLKSQIDHSCGNSLQGFKATLHQPSDLPRMKHSYFRVPFQHSVVAMIKPSITITSSALRQYDIEDRKCYFESERTLKFFKIYGQQNCFVECQTNFTLRICGCVEFSYPREEGTPICGPASIECTNYVRVAFLLNELPQNITASNISNPKYKYHESNVLIGNNRCNCLPSCHSISFETETSQTSGEWKEMFPVELQKSDIDETYQSGVQKDRVYLTELNLCFKNTQFETMQRSALYGTADFWAKVAGVTGLFTGFSFISIFEILYYLSLRIYCNIKRYGFKYWSGVQELSS